MSIIAVEKPGILCYRCDDHNHVVKTDAVVVNQGVFVAEVTHESEDGIEFTERSFRMIRPISQLVYFETEEGSQW